MAQYFLAEKAACLARRPMRKGKRAKKEGGKRWPFGMTLSVDTEGTILDKSCTGSLGDFYFLGPGGPDPCSLKANRDSEYF